MIEDVISDFKRYYVSAPLSTQKVIRLIWDTPGLKAILIYRLGRCLRSLIKRPIWWPLVLLLAPIYWLLASYIRFAYDIILKQSAEIGAGLFIGHLGGIRLRNCRLGTQCSIRQEVCLEPLAGGTEGPIVGDHVWIGAHARIIGPYIIANGATVGAGVRVSQNLEPRCLYIGNPARVVQKDFDNSSFI